MILPKRKNKLEYDGGLSQEEIIVMAMDAFGWSYKKILSWYNKENANLKKARPSELVERGNTDPIVELLQRRSIELKNNKERNK
jgi:hypothetical protein